MRVLICGGGTAGHVMPAVSIAQIIDKHFPKSDIAFAARSGGEENDAYVKTGRKIYEINISGIPRSISINAIKSLFLILKSGRLARRIIKEFNPDLIIGTGGYVCYPFLRQAERMKIKNVLHESNVYPGLVTRVLGKKCDALLLNHEGSKKYMRNTNNAYVVGNPTLSEFKSIAKSNAKRRLGLKEDQRLVVSFGGSLGAEKLNDTLLAAYATLSKTLKNVKFIHSTGRKYYEGVTHRYEDAIRKIPQLTVVPYIENMPTILSAADLAITRCGASTLAELCQTSTPSVLIPSPNVTANHQYINALYMKERGAAVLIEEEKLSSEYLCDAVKKLMDNELTLKKMSTNAKKMSCQNTEKMIADLIRNLKNA